MTLNEIEKAIRELHASICLRTNVLKARQIGLLLLEGKRIKGHGEYQKWYRGAFHFEKSTASDYTQLARLPESQFRRNGTLSIRQFLRLHKTGRELERLASLEDKADTRIRLNAELHNADCRSFAWPEAADAVVGDPPWDDDAAYDWLADFAARKLRPGGLCFVQCGQGTIHKRYQPFLDAGLTYHWTLCIVYGDTRAASVKCWFAEGWRPVLVYSQGRRRRHEVTTDTITVRKGEKLLHEWQQPLRPWRHWLEKMTAPGALVLDPYAGAGTVGVACVEVGRRYVGTEIVPRHARVARDRIGRAAMTL